MPGHFYYYSTLINPELYIGSTNIGTTNIGRGLSHPVSGFLAIEYRD